MKQCPKCRTNYADDTLRFCLEDGTPLIDLGEDPTVVRPGNRESYDTEILPANNTTPGGLANTDSHATALNLYGLKAAGMYIVPSTTRTAAANEVHTGWSAGRCPTSESIPWGQEIVGTPST